MVSGGRHVSFVRGWAYHVWNRDARPLQAMNFDYAASPYAIRDDIGVAHREVWAKIREPGCWWRGADRIAFVEEARNARSCEACARRRAASSPSADCGPHDTTTDLTDVVVDVVHRLTTDPARLSKSWLERINARGVTDEQYVELLGVVVAAISIDAFHRALGLPLEPLPTPEAGEPSGYRPAGVADSGAWVPIVHWEAAGEQEADLFGAGRPGNVIAAMSLVPDSVRLLLTLSAVHYLPLARVRTLEDSEDRAISRRQIELLAGRVSALSDCFY